MADYAAVNAKPSGDEKPVVGRAQGRYDACIQYRQPYLDRARECSELTLPYLIPPDGWTGTQPLYTPFQSMGSRGVNNVVAKLILALFPPNTPFGRFRMDGKTEDQAKDADPKLIQQIEEKLASMERKISVKMETQQMRPHLNEALKHLVVGGNVVLHFPEKPKGRAESIRVFHLNKFVCKMSPSGELQELVVKEAVSPRSLDRDFYEEVKKVVGYNGDDKMCDLYTYVYIDGVGDEREYKVYQEIRGLTVPGSEGSYPLDKLPWLVEGWNKIDGEDYSRGYVEDYLGDLKSLEGLMQSIVEGSAAAAKVLFLVNPNGSTRKDDIEKAPNGSVRNGNAEDITVLHLEKYNDFRVAMETSTDVGKRLAQAFMLNSSAQRNGERVTAEEWRYMIQDIEDALGGIYSVLAHKLQLPIFTLQWHRMTKAGELPAMPKGTVRPVIVTGLEALGRGHDLDNLRGFMKDWFATLTPEIAIKYVNADDLAKRLGNGYNLDLTGLIKTAEQMQAQQEAEAKAAQQQQMMEMVSKLGGPLMKTAGDAVKGQSGGPADAQGVAGAGAPAA